jgi:hypothetical protein
MIDIGVRRDVRLNATDLMAGVAHKIRDGTVFRARYLPHIFARVRIATVVTIDCAGFVQSSVIAKC